MCIHDGLSASLFFFLNARSSASQNDVMCVSVYSRIQSPKSAVEYECAEATLMPRFTFVKPQDLADSGVMLG